jgi:hypothetical protein
MNVVVTVFAMFLWAVLVWARLAVVVVCWQRAA